ncbi:MAG: exodeoxyribonuclease V subunit beta [Buchnera aphidicola (Kaburagia rhusicola rhusicola)]
MLNKIKNLDEAIHLLHRAEKSINELAVYTIHEFCYQSLNINKFCSNILFQNKIIKNKYRLYLQSSSDFWNEYLISLPKNIAKIIVKYFKNPNTLLNYILPLLSKNHAKKNTSIKKKINLIQFYNMLIQEIKIFKKKWLKNCSIMLISINKSNINKRSYNKSNLSRWTKIINIWALHKTENFDIPKELQYFKKSYLIKKTSNREIPKNNIFEIIENFLEINFSLKKIFVLEAIVQIEKRFNKKKETKGLFDFNDLIQFLYTILNKKNETITKIIKKQYPILLIDEFQDTDYQQYQIFKKIYHLKEDLCIFIGDPKQAIYSFRGANIKSYITAKKNIHHCYQLKINWRSSKEIVESLNLLFLRKKNIFLLPEINFIPAKSTYKNKQIEFQINGIPQPALHFILKKTPTIGITDYKTWITEICINYISFWLNEGRNGNAVIIHHKQTRYLTPKDICILVNNKQEAAIIQTALCKANIKTTYLSKRESVFHSTEAIELLWIFKAILNPKNKFLLKRAMSTTIIDKTSKDIDLLTTTYSLWSIIIDTFYEYLVIWKNFGITNMIHKIIINHKINATDNSCTYSPNISNILHIGELLEKKFEKIKKKHFLILWLEKKIEEKHDVPHTDYIRENNDKNCIEIVTIHKSKGLEYPIIWMPFFITLYSINPNISNVTNSTSNTIELKKTLSEDMRLLYVALTRTIVHCCIGIASINNKKKKDIKNYSDIHNNALGYIIQSGKKCNYQQLYNILLKMSHNKNIKISLKSPEINITNTKQHKKCIQLKNRKLKRTLEYNYKITSYSQLKNNDTSLILTGKNYHNCINTDIKIHNKNEIELTPHTFPRGKNIGVFIHKILKHIHFHKDINITWISQQLEKNNFKKHWGNMLQDWIYKILNTPLNNYNLCLSQLNPNNYVKELEFFLPIKNKLTDTKLNRVIRNFNSSAESSSKIFFDSIKGILVGSIDLVFKWEKKYYLVDYKSNWLGYSKLDYSIPAMQNVIYTHHYDLQYQLYSIALHRYLKKRINNYSFHKHFGGIYLLFLRARNITDPDKGLFFTLPTSTSIKQLDNLF